MVFTRQFSAFDRQNEATANSPFHGFYVLFWIAVALLIVKMGAENWRKTGSPLGTNEIMKYMFRRDGKLKPNPDIPRNPCFCFWVAKDNPVNNSLEYCLFFFPSW
jgi:hypothetical protein